MYTISINRQAELRALVADFLQKRLQDKLDKIKGDDEKSILDRQKESDRFEQTTWLASAAKRIDQIQLATHIPKATHPDMRVDATTNLYIVPTKLVAHDYLGSHVLGERFDDDVTGNAAALDVYKFLKLEHQGRSLLALVLAGDADLAAALSDDAALARDWINAFAKLIEPRSALASNTLAKQLYWFTGDDPHNDASYHLLAPLYASSLAHRIYQTVQDDRFSEEAKVARAAKKAGTFSARPVHEYPQMAVQQIGGTKPQTVSQLNSERRGNNFLFASLPPTWRSVDLKPLLNMDSMFTAYQRRPQVRRLVKTLLAFLKTDPARNVATRRQRAELVEALIDELLQFSAELGLLPLGWSQATPCKLSSSQKHWLDPDGVAQAYAAAGRPLPSDTDERISAEFARWLNAQLREPLPMGDPEFLEWREQMQQQIKAQEREAA